MEYYFVSTLLLAIASSLLIPFLVVLFVRFVCKSWKYRVLISQLPRGPRPLPFFGNALSFRGRYDRNINLLIFFM